MALPAGFVLEQESGLPPGFSLEEAAAPQRSLVGTALGRSTASLLDTTLGSIVPGAVQLLGYPLARAGRSAEEAKAMTERVAKPFEQPFGRAFGVSETPEYQQETSRQLVDFISRNISAGSKRISEATGVPQSDVESVIASLSMAAPKVARASAPVVESVATGLRAPFEPMLQARRERMSLEDYARGPQIEAAADAQRLGIALNPVDIQNTVGTRFTSATAGARGPEALVNVNRPQIRKIALADMGLPSTTQLNSTAAFNKARLKVSEPYVEVRKLPIQQADDAMIQRLEAVRIDLDVIGAKQYAPAISQIVDDAIAKTQTGLTGDKLLKNISVLRERARKTYNNKSATTEALDIADTNLKIATELESMIDNSITNPKLLADYREARKKMARTYVYEGATDLNTGILDVSKLARITAKDNALTGDVAALGRIAGNFPEVFTTSPTPGFLSVPRISRSGIGGALGALAGSQFGLEGSIAGGLVGGLVTEGLGAVQSRRMASPSYQSGLSLRDTRIAPEPQLTPAEINYGPNQLVPFDPRNAVTGAAPEGPNFVFGRPGPYVSPDRPTGPPQLGAPSAESVLGTLAQERARAAAMSRTLGRQAEAQQAAAEAATRAPTGAGQLFDLDPITGRLVSASAGIKGATPATFSDFGMALKTAAEKVTAGRNFDLTAAEKVAWNKTKIDFAKAAPELKGLSDVEIMNRITDREWAAGAVEKARSKARAFDEIALRAKTAEARRNAQKSRDELLDALEAMENSMLSPRPTRSGAQGPKTRAAISNQNAPRLFDRPDK